MTNVNINSLRIKGTPVSTDYLLGVDSSGLRVPVTQFAKASDLANFLVNQSTSWKNAVMINGWTTGISDDERLQYRFNKIGNLEVRGRISHANASSSVDTFGQLQSEDLSKATALCTGQYNGFAASMFVDNVPIASRIYIQGNGSFRMWVSGTGQCNVYFSGTIFLR